MTNSAFRNRFAQMAQLGQATGVQIVALASHVTGNRYTASPMEFAADGSLGAVVDAEPLMVVNLAETPVDGGAGTLGTVTAAVDVEGRWVVVVRPYSQLSFVGKVLSRNGAVYAVDAMDPVGDGTFRSRSETVSATNLRELDVTSYGGVRIGSHVLVSAVEAASNPPTVAYVFSVAMTDLPR